MEFLIPVSIYFDIFKIHRRGYGILRRLKKFHPNRSYACGVMSYRIFKMAAAATLNFVWVISDHTRSAIVGRSFVYKFGVDRIYSFRDTAISRFRCLP